MPAGAGIAVRGGSGPSGVAGQIPEATAGEVLNLACGALLPLRLDSPLQECFDQRSVCSGMNAVLQKVQLREGPLGGKIAIVRDLQPKVHFRFSDDEGTTRKAVYRQESHGGTAYVFEAEEPADDAADESEEFRDAS